MVKINGLMLAKHYLQIFNFLSVPILSNFNIISYQTTGLTIFFINLELSKKDYKY